MSGDIFIPVDYDKIKDRKVKYITNLYLISNSYFDKEKKVRIFNKNQINYTDLGLSFGKDRRTIKSDLVSTIEHYSEIFSQDDQNIYINTQAEGVSFTVALPQKTIETMLYTMNEITVRVFLYLYRQWSYWNSINHQGYDFAIGQLCRDIGYNPKSKGVWNAVLKAVRLLVANKIIYLDTIKKGRYIYRRVTYVDCRFREVEELEAKEEAATKGAVESDVVPQIEAKEEVVFSAKRAICLPGQEAVPSLVDDDDDDLLPF